MELRIDILSKQTGILMCAGDAIAQLAVERKPITEFDIRRSARFLGFGLVIAGPVLRGWYLTLDRLYKGSGKGTAALKMMTDQVVFAPTFLPFFLSFMALLRREQIEEIKFKLKRDFWPILMTNYKVWPAVQIVNFYFVPIQHRVLVVNIVALWWNTYLAWKAEKQSPSELTNHNADNAELTNHNADTTELVHNQPIKS